VREDAVDEEGTLVDPKVMIMLDLPLHH